MKKWIAATAFVLVMACSGVATADEGASHQGEPSWWLVGLFLFQCLCISVFAQKRYLVRGTDGTIRPAFTELQQFSAFLLSGTVIAQLWVHGDPDGYHATMHAGVAHVQSWFGSIDISAHFLVNEVFMAFFFALAAKELVEAFLKKDGALYRQKALLPVIACVGGVVGPVLVFLLLCSPERRGAWAVPCATDIAFAWLGARAIWGAKHPAVIFLLALAIVDDFIGMGIIAAAYPQRAFDPMGIAILGMGMGVAYGFRRLSVIQPLFQNWILYLLPGLLCWIGLLQSGLHAALALVFVVPFMPMKQMDHDEGLFADEEEHASPDTLNAFEHRLKPMVDVGLFFFGLCNAGVAWYGAGAWDRDSWAVFLGLGLGKLIGISLLTVIGFAVLRVLGLISNLPEKDGVRMQWRDVPVLGVLGAMGFTVALFVADAAGGHAGLKLGALASFAYLGLSVLIGKLVVRKAEPAQETESSFVSPVPETVL